ncbi:MAG: hypothetical protein LBG83_02440 [Oscillospiraceae bacterium]|nr:hypothetical protein [Oscillospiraceae bacterium]
MGRTIGALAAGLLVGGANYLLLAAGSRRFLSGAKGRGGWLMLGGVLLPVAGLALIFWLSPEQLLWFGCAAAGALVLLALIVHCKSFIAH